MPTSREGDPTATQAPSPTPQIGARPIAARPNDGEDEDAASIRQPIDTLTDYTAWLMDNGDDECLLEDDFIGDSVDAAKWKLANITTVGPLSYSLVDDAGNGSFGALKFDAAVAAGGRLDSAQFPLGTKDFRIKAAARVTALSGSGSPTPRALIGLSLANFFAVSGTANWQARLNGVNHDTGVAVVSAANKKLEIRRRAGTFIFSIDGAVVYSVATVIDLTGTVAQIDCGQVGGGGVTTAYFDFIRLWARR